MKIENDILTEDEVLEIATNFCEYSGMKLSTLGRKAVNNGKLFKRLEKDKTITLSSLNKLLSFMKDYLAKNSKQNSENTETTP